MTNSLAGSHDKVDGELSIFLFISLIQGFASGLHKASKPFHENNLGNQKICSSSVLRAAEVI